MFAVFALCAAMLRFFIKSCISTSSVIKESIKTSNKTTTLLLYRQPSVQETFVSPSPYISRLVGSIMSSLSATQSDGYYLPPEYYDSGHYKKVSRNRFAVESEVGAQNNNNSNSNSTATKKIKIGHNQWLKHGIIRFELPEKVRDFPRPVSACVFV